MSEISRDQTQGAAEATEIPSYSEDF